MVILANGVETLDHPCPVCGWVCHSKSMSVTLVGYRKLEGHDHDGNCRKFFFDCPQDHHFSVRVVNICPTKGCDWIGRASCFCHPDEPKLR